MNTSIYLSVVLRCLRYAIVTHNNYCRATIQLSQLGHWENRLDMWVQNICAQYCWCCERKRLKINFTSWSMLPSLSTRLIWPFIRSDWLLVSHKFGSGPAWIEGCAQIESLSNQIKLKPASVSSTVRNLRWVVSLAPILVYILSLQAVLTKRWLDE